MKNGGASPSYRSRSTGIPGTLLLEHEAHVPSEHEDRLDVITFIPSQKLYLRPHSVRNNLLPPGREMWCFSFERPTCRIS